MARCKHEIVRTRVRTRIEIGLNSPEVCLTLSFARGLKLMISQLKLVHQRIVRTRVRTRIEIGLNSPEVCLTLSFARGLKLMISQLKLAHQRIVCTLVRTRIFMVNSESQANQ